MCGCRGSTEMPPAKRRKVGAMKDNQISESQGKVTDNMKEHQSTIVKDKSGTESMLAKVQERFGSRDFLSKTMDMLNKLEYPDTTDLDAFKARYVKITQFPPKEGDSLTTNILLWDMNSWWGGAPFESEVFPIARSMAAVGYMMDYPATLRSRDWSLVPANTHLAALRVGGGKKRILAAAYTFTILLDVHEAGGELNNPKIKEVVSSLMNLPAVYKALGDGSELGEMLALAAQQNKDAKVSPVLSIQWAMFLKTMGATAKDAIAKYNDQIDVKAYVGSESGDPAQDARQAEIRVDNHKMYAIDCWMNRSTEKTVHAIFAHFRKETPKSAAFTEEMFSRPWMWVNSTVTGSTFEHPDAQAASCFLGEDSIEIDYNLPMDEHAHDVLFTRIMNDHSSDTMLVPPDQKHKYRRKMEPLLELRNIICFFCFFFTGPPLS